MEGRKLLDGRIAPEFDVGIELRIITKCPSKYKLLDMETGQVYVGQMPTEYDPYYWKRED